jgi:hypothetical protein
LACGRRHPQHRARNPVGLVLERVVGAADLERALEG